MKQKISVVNLVEAALGVQKPDVPLQFLAAPERGGQLVNDGGFLRGEGVGVFRVHGGKIRILQRIGHAADGNGLALIVNLVQ